MDTELKTLVDKMNIPATFQEWMVTNALVTIDDFVSASRNSADRIDDELITYSGVACEFKDKVAIRKCWSAAQMMMQERREKKSAVVDDGKPISNEDTQVLQTEFFRRHALKLGSKRLLDSTLQENLRKSFITFPKTFKLVLPDKLLLYNQVGTSMGNVFTIANGQMPKQTETFIDLVGDVTELWIRIRALLSTLSYVSISRPGWFGYGEADELSDQIFTWINTRYDGRRLGLQFFMAAYVATFQLWFEEIRLHDIDLTVLVKNVQSYRPFWVQPSSIKETPPVMAPPAHVRSGNSAVPDGGGNDVMIREMAKIRAQSDRLNSRVDIMDRRAPANEGAGGGGGGFKNNSKGGGSKGNGAKKNDGGGKRGRYGGERADSHRNGDQHDDHQGQRTDRDGRTYMKVRKGPNSDNYKGRNNR